MQQQAMTENEGCQIPMVATSGGVKCAHERYDPNRHLNCPTCGENPADHNG